MTAGLSAALRRMGHEVTDCPLPAGDQIHPAAFEALKAGLPEIQNAGAQSRSDGTPLQDQDAILVSGPEWVGPWLDAIYGKYEWKNLGIPRAGWYHESFFREDRVIDFDEVAWISDEHFFPACQDAEFFDQEHFAKGRAYWLPFGVDTQVFKLGDRGQGSGCSGLHESRVTNHESRKYDIAFVGLMYEKRAKYLAALSKHNHPPIRFGNVQVQDLSGSRMRDSAELLAENYSQVKVFLNLPSLSQLLVSKVCEVMACGTFLLTPMLAPERGANKNMAPFELGKHLVYYRPAHLGGLAQALREWSSDEKSGERKAIARAGCEEVHSKHRLEQRLEMILERVGLRVALA